jgi:hypothetical protein
MSPAVTVFHPNHKEYFPLKGIAKIVVHPPEALLPEGAKRASLASLLPR